MIATSPELRRLADCGRLLSGGTPSKSRADFWGGDIPWFSSKELKTFDLVDTELGVTDEAAQQGSTLVPPGTISFVIRGMSLANEFRVGVTSRVATFNQDVKAVVPHAGVDARYLARCLQTLGPRVVSTAETSSHGTKRLPSALFENLPIPLPPLPEQRRIADLLDRADAIRRKREEALALTDELLRSTFLDMFGDPVTNPKGWPVRPLGDMCELYAGNSLPPGTGYFDQPDGVLLLKVGDMNLPGNERRISRAREWAATGGTGIVAPAGAVVFPKRGGAIATNKKRVLERPAALDPNLMAASVRTAGVGDEFLENTYLEVWFQLLDLSSLSNGSAIPQINKGDILPLALQTPSLGQQREFARFTHQLDRLRLASERAVGESTSLYHALQQTAFSSRLPPLQNE